MITLARVHLQWWRRAQYLPMQAKDLSSTFSEWFKLISGRFGLNMFIFKYVEDILPIGLLGFIIVAFVSFMFALSSGSVVSTGIGAYYIPHGLGYKGRISAEFGVE